MNKASRDFIVIGLDGSRAVKQHVQQDSRATALSILNDYLARPATPAFNNITLLEFAQQNTMLRELSAQPNRRNQEVVVITWPYCPPDTARPKYEQYCPPAYWSACSLFIIHRSLCVNVPASLGEEFFRRQQENAASEVCVLYIVHTVHNYTDSMASACIVVHTNVYTSATLYIRVHTSTFY